MAEITTFYEYIKNHDIKIPIIQRDYAQGRKNDRVNNVRNNLLESLKKALDKGTTLDLNFVYGTIEGESDRKVFIPVDGQQRLTTLYLLHYFLFVVSGNEEIKNINFFYETRSSATEFFAWLGKVPDPLKNVFKSDKFDNLEEKIYEMPEYQSSWKNDPTVASAITMLYDIKRIFGVDNADKYTSILCGDNCPIQFSVIEDEPNKDAKINADKAYIRMNARGKSLNDFENLRAVIDRIDNNLEDNKVKIIDNYDKIYINSIFKKCCESMYIQTETEITEITNKINQKSYAAFANIFYIVSLSANFSWYKSIKDSSEDRSKYISRLYGYSKNENNEKENSEMQVYLEALDTYFEFSCPINDPMRDNCIFYENVFWNYENINLNKDYRNVVAEVIYCYFYKKNHGKIPNCKQVEKLLYILKNLDFCKWNDYFINIYPNPQNSPLNLSFIQPYTINADRGQ